MKTLIAVLGIVGMFGLVSCEKDHNCVCVNSNDEVIRTNTYSGTYDEALDLCNASAGELNDNDSIGETYFCTLE